jgi:hypothetical protein
MGNGLRSGVSWMWLPALLFLVLDILLARAIFGKINTARVHGETD